MDPIKDSHQIFKILANELGDELITDLDKIDRFFKRLMEATKGLVIVDFLDTTNWDKFDWHKLEVGSGILTLAWHDYRGVVESEEEKEVRTMVFPASLYAAALRVKSLMTISTNATAIFLLNGYSLSDKEIRSLYAQDADHFEVHNNDFFSQRIVRQNGFEAELIRVHRTPLFSMAIIPKMSPLTSTDSKKVLYDVNLGVAVGRLESLYQALDSLEPSETEEIADKVNAARRTMEYALKVECCLRGLMVKKTYAQLLLGDLISLVKDDKDESIRRILSKFAELANEFSHDSGRPVSSSHAKLAVILGRTYVEMIRLSHKLNNF